MTLIREQEFQKLATSKVIDLTGDKIDPLGLGIPIEQVVMVETILEFAETFLKYSILWDWDKNSDYYNKNTLYTDSYELAVEEIKSKKFSSLKHNFMIPEIYDILSETPPPRIRKLGLNSTFGNIRGKVENLSRIISNLGLKHPPPFSLVKSQDLFGTYLSRRADQ